MFNPTKFLRNPDDALQAPCHRWLRCWYLHDYGRSPSTQDDAITHEAWAFLRDWERCRSDAAREQLTRSYPALAEAHQFAQHATRLQRGEVEARLLASEGEESIASKCNLSPAGVHLFHDVFFDVRPYLRAECYIVNVAIGPKVHHGLRSDDHDILLKLAGYTMGPLAVDQLLAYIADPPVWPDSLTQLDDAALEKLRDKLLMRAWILSLTMPADAAASARLPVIQRVLAQARALRLATERDRNSPLAALDAPLNWREFLSAPTLLAAHHATTARPGTVFDLPQSMGCITPHPAEREAVPA